jgi:hypothetical protein
MVLIDQNISENELERYVLAEMDAAERDAFDERVLADDELFLEAAEMENRFVDAYAAGTLTDDTLTRFERSLEVLPARRQKLDNARSLMSYIEEARPMSREAEQPAGRISIWDRIAGLVGGRSPLLAYGMAAAIVILAVASGLLFVQNQRKNDELARLQETQQRQAELQSELERSRQRETELRSSIDAERDASGDLQEELDRERTRREEIERELGKIRNTNAAPPGPIIASVVLSPFGGRGGDGGAGRVTISSQTKRVSLRLDLPDVVEAGDRLTVKLNQKPVASDVAPRIIGRKRSINVTVTAAGLNKGRNDIDIVDSKGAPVGNYKLDVVQK